MKSKFPRGVFIVPILDGAVPLEALAGGDIVKGTDGNNTVTHRFQIGGGTYEVTVSESESTHGVDLDAPGLIERKRVTTPDGCTSIVYLKLI